MLSELSLTLHVSPSIDDGVVRIDPSDMRLMGVMPGDVVALAGARTSYARVQPATMEDRNQRLALVSPLSSRNTGVQTGHKIQILAERRIPVVAEKVTLIVNDDLDLLHITVRQKQLVNFWHERSLAAGDWLNVPSLDRNPLLVQVVATQPEGLVQIGGGTRYAITSEQKPDQLAGLGGLRDIYRTCQSLAMARLKSGLKSAARSVLLTGPSGCGKAQLVKRLGEDLGVAVVTLDANRLMDKQLMHTPSDLSVSLTELARRGPTLVVLDHLQSLSLQDHSPSALVAASRLIMAQFCALLDEVAMHPGIMLFGIGSGPVDPRLKARQRFDVILPIDAPNRLERQEILVLSTRSLPVAENVDLARLAEVTSGATARDLRQLVTTASRLALGHKITGDDFNDAARHCDASAANDVHCDIPAESWSDVAGLDDIKQLLRETLSWSLKYRDRFAEAGVAPPRSILLSGGQGTGKTSLVRALVNIVPLNFIDVECTMMASFDPAAAVRVIHDTFVLARRKSPCLVFFDDIDVLFDVRGVADTDSKASPVIPQLLVELDRLALMPGVVVVAATNRPDRLSADILRPGRFDFAVTLPMPDTLARKKIFQIHARKLPLAADIDFDRLAAITQGLSPSEIANLCNRVGLMALRQSLSEEHGGIVPPVANAALFEHVMRGRKG